MIMHLFEKILSVSAEDIKFERRGYIAVEWLDFLLNPRRLRGSDFLMCWSQGAWSEERIIQAVNDTCEFFAIPYGPSGTAPDKDIREFERYFERLEAAGLGENKRPDLLIFKNSSQGIVDKIIHSVGGAGKLPFTPESSDVIQELLDFCKVQLDERQVRLDFGQTPPLFRSLDDPGDGFPQDLA